MKTPSGMLGRLKQKLFPVHPMTEKEIEAEVLKQLAYKREGARAAEAITAEDLNAVVGPSPEFGSRVRF